MPLSNLGKQTSGKPAVRGKNEWWFSNNQVHSLNVTGPFLGESQFGLILAYDFTELATGIRRQFSELALYTVAGGKIVRDEFFYGA